jgi:4'-phosphopantetheinyl transferase
MEHPPRDARALSHGCVHLWSVGLAQSKATVDALLDGLSPDERDRAARFRFERHRNRFVVARGVLRSILAGYLDLEPGHVSFAYGPAGKPELTGSSVSFNLSHSDDLAVYAVGVGRAIGIDLEALREMPEAGRIARHVCSPREQAALHDGGVDTLNETLLAYWTCKEAYVKARGEGMTRPLRSIEVDLGPGQAAHLRSVDGDEGEAARWRLDRLSLSPGYLAALVVEGSDWTLTSSTYALTAQP